jgi:hypothetical protein
MAKYGRGLNREVVGAVNQGIINEPFSVAEVRQFIIEKGWAVPENYIIVCLSNGSSYSHSPTYKKYFNALQNGKYKVSPIYKGPNWC